MDEKTKEVYAKNRKERIDIQHMFNHLCHNALVWAITKPCYPPPTIRRVPRIEMLASSYDPWGLLTIEPHSRSPEFLRVSHSETPVPQDEMLFASSGREAGRKEVLASLCELW